MAPAAPIAPAVRTMRLRRLISLSVPMDASNKKSLKRSCYVSRRVADITYVLVLPSTRRFSGVRHRAPRALLYGSEIFDDALLTSIAS